MRPIRSFREFARQSLLSLMAYSLLIAPVGCLPINIGDLPPDGGGTSGAGFWVNSDVNDRLIAAARSSARDTFFVYGERNTNGDIRQVDSILVRLANGSEGLLAFESGRPTLMRTPDGSEVRVAYTEVTPTRLAATITFFSTGSNQTENFPVDIDLNRALTDVAAAFERATGERLTTTGATAEPTAAKTAVRGQLVAAIGIAAAVGLTIGLASNILGQGLTLVADTVTLVAQAALVSFLGPLIWISEIMGAAVFNVRTDPLSNAFDATPEPPVVDVL